MSAKRGKGQQPGGASPALPGLRCRGAASPPHIRAPGNRRAGPRAHGLTCTARVKKMPASDASFFMLKSMMRRKAGHDRLQRNLAAPARRRRRRRRGPAPDGQAPEPTASAQGAAEGPDWSEPP